MFSLCMAIAGILQQPCVPEEEPRASDIMRFPCEWIAIHNEAFSARWVGWLESRLRYLRATHADIEEIIWIADTLEETESCHQAWADLTFAWWQGTRDLDMARLRRTIGLYRYKRGLMPPVVPWWRFQAN